MARVNDDESASRETSTVLRAAIDEAIAELEAGLGEETTVGDLMEEVRREVGL